MIFTTARCDIRPWSEDDLAAIREIYRDPEVTRYLGGTTQQQTLDDSRHWLERITTRNAALPAGLGIWAVVLREHQTPIGTVMLCPLPDTELIEVGYHLGRQWWGQGLAKELARGAVAYGFATRHLPQIVGVTFPENQASQAVLRAVGFRHVEQGNYYGRLLDLFALTQQEWQQQPTEVA